MVKLQSKEYSMWNLSQFSKVNNLELKLVLKDLDIYERCFLLSIQPYIGYEDCCLKHDNGKTINLKQLEEITPMSRGKLLTVINSLEGKSILFKGKNGKNTQYFINPWLFCKGNRINKSLKDIFKNYRIRTEEMKKWGKLI